jgi:two-component system, chemotaxis family, sensor kinase CheA
MTSKSETLLKRLLAIFKPEAEDHLNAMSSGLLELEKEKEPAKRQSLIESIYREAHSLKGAARAVNLNQVETLCQEMESVLAEYKHGQIPTTTSLFDAIHQAIDTLSQIIAATYDDSVQSPASVNDALKRLNQLTQADKTDKSVESSVNPPLIEIPGKITDSDSDSDFGSQFKGSPVVVDLDPAQVLTREEHLTASDTVRIATTKLDTLLVQAEGMLGIKLSNAQRSTELSAACGTLEKWFHELKKIQPDWNVFRHMVESSNKKDDLELSIPSLKRLDEFLGWTHQRLQALENELLTLAKKAEQDSRSTGRMVDDLLEDMKQVVMLPCSTLFESFPKIVRNLARGLGKEVDWIAKGTNIEIDKRILEELKAPLVHLIRNCVDHGIETPDERERQAKPRRGKISLSVAQVEGGKVEICVVDDGAGIDFDKVKTAVLKRGFLKDAEKSVLKSSEVFNLIFQSELSTSPIITNISGRGLGLAIAKEKVTKLGGQISVKSKDGEGTTFCISLPISLATFRGVLVIAGGQPLIIPSIQVDCVTRVRRDSIQTIENDDTILFHGHPIALVALEDVLSLERTSDEKENNSDMISILALGGSDQPIAFSVSEVVQEQEVLVKSLPYPVIHLKNVSGATLLGDGRIAPILNVAGLLQSALGIHGSKARLVAKAKSSASAIQQKKSILVAEDSITSRMLLQNILESANYQVQTEVDGMAAWAALKTGEFDLLVSDVQMPRMDGFELTAKVRSDSVMGDLPVVLVSRLLSPPKKARTSVF